MKAFRNEGYVRNVNGAGNISRKPLSRRRAIRVFLALADKQERAAHRANSLKTKETFSDDKSTNT